MTYPQRFSLAVVENMFSSINLFGQLVTVPRTYSYTKSGQPGSLNASFSAKFLQRKSHLMHCNNVIFWRLHGCQKKRMKSPYVAQPLIFTPQADASEEREMQLGTTVAQLSAFRYLPPEYATVQRQNPRIGRPILCSPAAGQGSQDWRDTAERTQLSQTTPRSVSRGSRACALCLRCSR